MAKVEVESVWNVSVTMKIQIDVRLFTWSIEASNGRLQWLRCMLWAYYDPIVTFGISSRPSSPLPREIFKHLNALVNLLLHSDRCSSFRFPTTQPNHQWHNSPTSKIPLRSLLPRLRLCILRWLTHRSRCSVDCRTLHTAGWSCWKHHCNGGWI